MTAPPRKPKLAFWFRYGAAEHAELFHALPQLIEELSQSVDVHYYGMKSERAIPESIRNHATLHALPFRVRRTSNFDKFLKTLLWILSLPFIARHARRQDIDCVYMDEAIPFAAWITHRFFGRNYVITVADFFVDIYLTPNRLLRPAGRWIRNFDLRSWRTAALVITRARTTRNYLMEHGISPDRVRPIYDPCDTEIFRPLDKESCRKAFGFKKEDIVLVHHGILHPNKGNDRILMALARLRDIQPGLKFLLIGDGPDMNRIKEMVRTLDLADRVTLTGWLPDRADVNKALNAGDIGLVMRAGHASDHFHMTGALVHNMACGLPILAARLGGIAEVVREGDNGLLFDPACSEEFDENLLRLCRNTDLRETMGKQARVDAVALFSMTSVVQATTQVLTPLLTDCSFHE